MNRYIDTMGKRQRTPLVLPNIAPEACTFTLRRELLKENPLFAELDDREIADVAKAFRERGFDAGAPIARQGEKAETLFIVALGVVKLFQIDEGGRETLIDILSSGDYFGSLAGYGPEQYEATARAASTVCALSIDAAQFRQIAAAHPSVALGSVEALANRLTLAREMMTQLRGQEARTRVALVILRLAEKLGQPWDGKRLIRSPLSREELASMAATTTETCSRILSSFKKGGFIDSGRGWVAVTDGEMLAKAAGISNE